MTPTQTILYNTQFISFDNYRVDLDIILVAYGDLVMIRSHDKEFTVNYTDMPNILPHLDAVYEKAYDELVPIHNAMCAEKNKDKYDFTVAAIRKKLANNDRCYHVLHIEACKNIDAGKWDETNPIINVYEDFRMPGDKSPYWVYNVK